MSKEFQSYTPEQVRAFFDHHRTVRQYVTQEDGSPLRLPAEHLDVILHAAQRAPTDATAQLYSIIHLTDSAVRAKVAELTNNAHVATSSEAFVICADVGRVAQTLREAGYTPGEWPSIAVHFGIGDAVMAGQNLLLASEMLGYQGCWIGGVLNGLIDILELLALPEGVLPFAALTIGQSNEDAPYRPRLPRPLVIHENSYQIPASEALRAGIELMNPIAERPGKPGDWAKLLNMYFGAEGRMNKRELTMQEVLKRQGLK